MCAGEFVCMGVCVCVCASVCVGIRAHSWMIVGILVELRLIHVFTVAVLVELRLTWFFRRIPEGTGWVIDGYPQNYNQAKLLEKALSGYDANAKENLKQAAKSKTRKSSLVPDPRPPPPPSEPASGIDVVILFDIDDELCLKRASGRTCMCALFVAFFLYFRFDDLGCAVLCEQQALLIFRIIDVS